MVKYYTVSCDEALKKLDSSLRGLDDDVVNQKKIYVEKIRINKAKRESLIVKFFKQFSDLMVLILLLAASVSVVLGIVEKSQSEIIDGVIIFGIVLINAIFGLIQEWKSEKAIDSLKTMTEPECLALRNGNAVLLHSNDLVYGDIVMLEAGATVPADCRLIESFSLTVDESSLTGESVPVKKNCDAILNENTVLADRVNMVFKGGNIVSGRAVAVVCGIGIESEIGKIAKVIEETKKELTPLQQNIKSVGKVLTFIILLVAGITFVLEILARGNPLDAFLTAVAISVAAIPESLPAVITIIMSIGIARLAKQKAIVKRMHAVETLGCCDFVCSDKTGTITENKMTVTKTFCDGKFDEVNDIFLKTITLCNNSVKSKNNYLGDPTEVALSVFASKNKVNKNQQEKSFERIDEKSFTSERKMMSTLNNFEGKTVFAKGAVNTVLDLCDKILINGKVLKIDENFRNQILKVNDDMSRNALRVLALAYKKNDGVSYDENNLIFVGLVGMIDPPRKKSFDAVKTCKKAGMTPIMITGDHKNTAFAIAKQVGIAENLNQVMTGIEMDRLSDEKLSKALKTIRVFARVSPENKTRIVKILKEDGHIVSMTGDGVNDAPSLKSASIGIGMGISGVDVTKEVADIVITDDNFSTIVIAVEEGRKIYKNIQKTVKFLFSANMAEIMALFLATIIFPQLTFLLPVQILFVNLITDSLPAIALGVEKAESNIMEEKPRSKSTTLFSNGVWKEIAIMGSVQTILVLVAFVIGLNFVGQETATTMAFYTLNLLQLFYLFSVRTEKRVFETNPFKNKLFSLSMIFGIGTLLLIALTPIHTLLGLTDISLSLWIVVLALSMLVIVFNEIYKFVKKNVNKNKGEF